MGSGILKQNPKIFTCQLIWPARLLAILLSLLTSPTVKAEFTYITNDASITITGYTGSGGVITIPGQIGDMPVTTIGTNAFFGSAVTTVTIPASIISIQDQAFLYCENLTCVYFQGNAPILGVSVFGAIGLVGLPPQLGIIYPSCYYLPGTTGWDSNFGGCPTFMLVPPYICTVTNGAISISSYTGSDGVLVLPTTIAGLLVTRIESRAFYLNTNLISITIPQSVESIGYQVFGGCTSLKSVYFMGNAPATDTPPSYDWTEFSGDTNVIAYYLPGTTGWSTVFGDGPTAYGTGSQGGAQTALWLPSIQTTDTSFGVLTNQFGFNINWASGETVVVEAATNLLSPIWCPVSTNTLITNSIYFSDPQWMNYLDRFYRISSQ